MESLTPLVMLEQSNPTSPSAGSRALYPKADGHWYSEGSSGLETRVSANGMSADNLGGGFKAWTHDPMMNSGGLVLPANGVMYLVGLWTPVDILVSKIHFSVQTAGATLTAGQQHVALYGADRVRLADADPGAAFTSTGFKTVPITPVTVPAGRFWVAFLANGTTRPSINRAVGQGLAAMNGLHGANAYRVASSGTAQTTPPAGPITLAAATTTPYWAAVS